MSRVIGGGLDAYLNREARERALNVVMEAREAAERLVAEAKTETAARREEVLARTREGLERQKRQAIARARLEARREVAARRQEFLDRLWREAQARLEHHGDDDPAERLRVLGALLRDAAEQLGGGDLEVAVGAGDRALLTPEVLRAWSDCLRRLGVTDLTPSEEPAPIHGGVVARRRGTPQMVDNSFEGRLALVRRTLRDEVGMRLVPRERDIE